MHLKDTAFPNTYVRVGLAGMVPFNFTYWYMLKRSS